MSFSLTVSDTEPDVQLLGIWSDHISDMPAFCQLFQLSIPALTAVNPNSVSTEALQTFVNMSVVDTRMYVEFINSIIVNSQQTTPTSVVAAITSIYPLVHKYPTCLTDHLVVITSLLFKVLDLHFPAIRNACLPASTNILRYLAEKFPMVTVHNEKQKFAVGNHEGIVVIYDMRTASKWQLFEAHKSSIAGLAFSPNGEMLVSFAPKEQLCRVFKINNNGVSTINPYKTLTIKSDEILGCVRLEWNSDKMFTLKPDKNKNISSLLPLQDNLF